MIAALWLALWVATFAPQAAEIPAYIRQGDRIEQKFRDHHDKLNSFYAKIHDAIARDAAELLPLLQGEPPRPVVYGYQLLPEIFSKEADSDPQATEFHSYSWPLTEGYVTGEETKLALAAGEFNRARELSGEARREALQKLAENYRRLVANQKTIDQYIEYNRFWQRAVATDRSHFDQMTEIYNLLQKGEPDTTRVINEALGKPEVPAFIHVLRPDSRLTIFQIPLYTDIADDSFLTRTKAVIERFWQADDGVSRYRIEVELHRISAKDLYPNTPAPEVGSHFDVRAHAGRFPANGAVLTTGAESTYAAVGRFIGLGTGDLSEQTLAHEFGHLLGFRDGYIRGYKDIGKDGLEILEMIPNFDDIMSAPARGHVQPIHFKLLLANLPSN